jgi:tRNA uracil 4-sulfurtransferase
VNGAGTGSSPVADRLFILRQSGDLYTKARKTRLRFQARLEKNIRDALRSHGIEHRLTSTWSRSYVETPAGAPGDEDTAEVLSRVFGLRSVSVAEPFAWGTLEELVDLAVPFFAASVRGRSFAVRATRRGDRERIPFDSQAVEVALGRALLDRAGAARVDLDEPEAVAFVEVEPGEAHLFHGKKNGWGGLPLGVEGRALALVSGGFDSAVASWLMLKRGVELDYVFCNLGGTAHRLGVLKVMKVIADRWSYGSRPRLFEIDFQPVAAELREKARAQHWQIVLKRQMVRAAALLAHRLRRPGIVTGEAVGQVSSQTLHNLAVISLASPDVPLLRPLLGFNKEEILALARSTGIHDLAAAVGEYCDMVPRHPATRALPQAVLNDETSLDPGLLPALVAARRVHNLRALPAESLAPSSLEIDRVPEGATVLDLRALAAFHAWHWPGALHLDFPRALEAWPSFDRARAYVIVCEVGLKSAHLAERMQEAGFRAWHFAGGAGDLMARAVSEGELEASLLAPAVR